jgi:hypothetical protein
MLKPTVIYPRTPREKLTLVIVLSSSVFLQIDKNVVKRFIYRGPVFFQALREARASFIPAFRRSS